MHTTYSEDGTAIAYETCGQGPALILVDGALCYRKMGPSPKVAASLSEHFTVVTYDRRGRGESADSAPYSVNREVEDLAALIAAVGGSAYLCGFSSGAVLALDAAASGLPITGLALYEPPFIVDDSRAPGAADYVEQLRGLLSSDRRGDAVRLFMRHVGLPGPLIALMPLMPAWGKLKRVAHTLPYDGEIMGDTQLGRPLPTTRWLPGTKVKTHVIVGGKSPAFFHNGTKMLADLLPNADHHVLDGQTHMVKAKALAPLLIDCFGRTAATERSANASMGQRVLSA
ncbi:MAG TPA: alpha/beta hydrolase [Solirubrobacteraceae bacterium]|nr:alpha/beta hydrolase [Solirubrobacteraceae bacterium]